MDELNLGIWFINDKGLERKKLNMCLIEVVKRKGMLSKIILVYCK